MAVRATFAAPDNRTVNLWLDADSVRPGLPLDDPEIAAFIKGGGRIDPYEQPAPPDTLDQIDTKALNAALAEEGSVTRALSEIVFGLAKGTILINPLLTKQQFVTMLKAKMRT